MSKKNSNVILKNGFKDFENLSKIYLNFKQKLISSKKKSFIVAVSGGPDSLALAALSKALSFDRKLKFYYVLIDHNIRKNSKKEANQVRSLLKKYKINLKIISNKLIIQKNIQSQAREIRYKFLSNFCKKKNTQTILTAHNLEDQVETFFIRLSRGSGLKGLSAMEHVSKLSSNIKLSRPLLDTKKIDLMKISKLIFGFYFRDPSNKNQKYLRTRIRNLKKPLIKSGINYDQIIRSINNLASSKATLENYYQYAMNESVQRSKNEILVNLKKFNTFSKEIKIRILNDSIKLLKKNYYNIRSKKVINLIMRVNSKNFKKTTLGGCLFFVKKDHLCLKIEEKH